MSRIGRMPVAVPAGVQVQVEGSTVRVKGPKGELEQSFPPEMQISLEEGVLTVLRPSDARTHRALHGMTRALINNMVTGVNAGFEKVLEVNGVGYRAEMDGKKLVLYVGYSHPVVMDPPEGINFETDPKTRQIKIKGYDKQAVGQVAANVRSVRPVEPYHEKGIKYLGEKVRRKAGKTGKG
ncbi:MAG: 50S ribosomal protein L6 [Chloroflexota bacterium]